MKGPLLDEYEHDERAVACESAICRRATPKAILVDFGDDCEAWIPQSQIHEDSEVYREGDSGRLVITRWIAEQKGWA